MSWKIKDKVVRRVPADFDWTIGRVWMGCIRPACPMCPDPLDKCSSCSGWEPELPGGDWWQLWEDISEGSPITPAFADKEDLVVYLAEVGDSMYRRRWSCGMGMREARRLVEFSMADECAVRAVHGLTGRISHGFDQSALRTVA